MVFYGPISERSCSNAAMFGTEQPTPIVPSFQDFVAGQARNSLMRVTRDLRGSLVPEDDSLVLVRNEGAIP